MQSMANGQRAPCPGQFNIPIRPIISILKRSRTPPNRQSSPPERPSRPDGPSFRARHMVWSSKSSGYFLRRGAFYPCLSMPWGGFLRKLGASTQNLWCCAGVGSLLLASGRHKWRENRSGRASIGGGPDGHLSDMAHAQAEVLLDVMGFEEKDRAPPGARAVIRA